MLRKKALGMSPVVIKLKEKIDQATTLVGLYQEIIKDGSVVEEIVKYLRDTNCPCFSSQFWAHTFNIVHPLISKMASEEAINYTTNIRVFEDSWADIVFRNTPEDIDALIADFKANSTYDIGPLLSIMRKIP